MTECYSAFSKTLRLSQKEMDEADGWYDEQDLCIVVQPDRTYVIGDPFGSTVPDTVSFHADLNFIERRVPADHVLRLVSECHANAGREFASFLVPGVPSDLNMVDSARANRHLEAMTAAAEQFCLEMAGAAKLPYAVSGAGNSSAEDVRAWFADADDGDYQAPPSCCSPRLLEAFWSVGRLCHVAAMTDTGVVVPYL